MNSTLTIGSLSPFTSSAAYFFTIKPFGGSPSPGSGVKNQFFSITAIASHDLIFEVLSPRKVAYTIAMVFSRKSIWIFENDFSEHPQKRSAIIVAEYASATFEVLGGFLITIISFPPFGSFKLTACYNSQVIYDDISKFRKIFKNLFWKLFKNLTLLLIY